MWTRLPSGPMKKCGSGMIVYDSKLVLFGGLGIPSGPTQPGSEFIVKESDTDGLGWTNELHTYNLKEGETFHYKDTIATTLIFWSRVK